jgi:Na+-driven multidrug efflux pump
MILAWTCIIGLGAALTFGVPQWGSLGPWSAAGVYIILLGLALWYRFLSGRWRDMHLLEHSAGSREPSTAGSASPSSVVRT